MKVYTSNICGLRVLNYVYRAGSEMAFHFHLLSEVGEPWQAQARDMAEQLAKASNAEVEQMELDKAPGYVDALIKRKNHEPI